MAKDKDKATEDDKRRAQKAERARALAEQSLAKMGIKLGGMELKLAEAESLNLAQANEIVELKATLEACEDKWYNAGFTDAENFVEQIIYQSQCHEFGEGWVAVLQVMGVPDDFPLKNLEQIPYPEPSPPLVQNLGDVEETGDTPSMRELVNAIDSHVELVDLKITSNLDAVPRSAPSSTLDPATQPIGDAQTQPAADIVPLQPDDPTV